jgi:WhiB family redox-sensing transcriptional regulator
MSHHTGSVPDTPRKTDWRDIGACRTSDPEIFFASPLTSEGKEDVRSAKVVCFGCESRLACGEWALETREPWGVWGGMTEGERKTILRRRAEHQRAKAA